MTSVQKVSALPSFIPSPSLSSPPPMLKAWELAVFDKMTDEHLKGEFILAYVCGGVVHSPSWRKAWRQEAS